MQAGDTFQIFRPSLTFVLHKKCRFSMEHVFAQQLLHISPVTFAHVRLGSTIAQIHAHNAQKTICALIPQTFNSALHYQQLLQEHMKDAFAPKMS